MNTIAMGGSMILVLAGLAAAGCTAKEKEVEPQTPTLAVVSESSPQQVTLKSTAPITAGVLAVDSAIVAACGLPTPHFAFDSAKILDGADGGLDKIAACFTTGPLAGRNVRLVGHADPRGETEYNFALGQRRAGSVGTYLITHGVNSSQVTATSRGELDAIGTDEEGWALDRRVDMLLAE